LIAYSDTDDTAAAELDDALASGELAIEADEVLEGSSPPYSFADEVGASGVECEQAASNRHAMARASDFI
jgi:hypothetical protein